MCSRTWKPVFGESRNDINPLPSINDKHPGEEYSKSHIRIDLNDATAMLWKYQSGAKFVDIAKEDIPNYSKIQCREELGFRIPNLVHYVWIGPFEMKFHQYLSLR